MTTTTTREAAIRERALSASAEPKPCAICGVPVLGGKFCNECSERARPYEADDPYDDLGGEN